MPSKKSKKAAKAKVAPRPASQPSPENLRELWQYFGENRPGLIGFGLSLLQFLFHASWLGFVAWLTSTGRAEQLAADSWQMWVIALLIVAGTATTAVALFLCLYGTLRGSPRLLAGIGLCLSFFVGAVTTFTLLLNTLGGKT